MINKIPAAVVIPLYKSFFDLNSRELLSLRSTLINLNKYVHVLVIPRGFDCKDYLSFCCSFNVKVITMEFDGNFFYNIEGYNRLLMSSLFYKEFERYEYILVFQLDAYVFRDELQKWCEKGFDYIGAPWFEGFDVLESNKIVGVGNGGFSLRKVEGAIKLLERLRMLQVLEVYKDFNWKGVALRLFQICSELMAAKKNESSFEMNYHLNEDFFWGLDAPERANTFICKSFFLKAITLFLIGTKFKVASGNDAFKFAFENNPNYLFEMNNKKLPFGCHGWGKYGLDFWKEFIPMEEEVK